MTKQFPTNFPENLRDDWETTPKNALCHVYVKKAHWSCGKLLCDECRLSVLNPTRTTDIKTELERIKMIEKPVSLANSEQFPAGVGVAINRDMLVWDDTDDKPETQYVTAWNGYIFHSIFSCYGHAAELPAKKMRPMTAKEIAMLPRGTAFIFSSGDRIYNPLSQALTDGIHIGEYSIRAFSGYLLPTDPDDMEPRKFEVEI
jgi:hypothetical protein